MAEPLSPAARAVLDAFTAAACNGGGYDWRLGVAAALRVAGEQLEAAPGASRQRWGIIAAERQLRGWATELEAARQVEQP